MSTLKADTIQSTGGGAVTLTKQQAAKAWANISGSDSPVIDDSLNVTSLTDGGTGQVQYNWTNAMSNANYACLHGIMRDTNTGYARGASGTDLTNVTTGLLSVLQVYGSSGSSDGAATGGAAHDSAAIIGDLA